MTRFVTSLYVGVIVWAATAADVRAQPSGSHPRALLTPAVKAAWQELAAVPSSPVGRSIARCDDAHDDPSEYEDGQYQGFRWVEAMTACLVAYAATDSAVHRDTAIVYFEALISDESTVGDGLGPSYDAQYGIVAQDSGYSMRTHGVFAALGYDWLHDSLDAGQRAAAHAQFVRWIAFHHDADTYQRDTPGANYHAGHVLAMTLLAIGHADEMNALSAGSGDALYDYVVDTMWGDVMAEGHGERGVLASGDWLEGWQYGPLSVVSYSLAGRALVEQGESIPWLADYGAEILDRYVHGLTPDDRWFVGGDTQSESPYLEPSALPLYGVVAGVVADSVRAEARGELARLGLGGENDFQLFHEALAAAATTEATAIDRATLPIGFLARGAGNYYARTRHDANAVFAVSQCKGIVVDHQHENAGNLVLSRGADALLVDPGPYGSLSTLTGNAPTMDQPHFNDEYRPSQAAFGEWWGGDRVPEAESTRMIFGAATSSGVHATRCDYTGQFRFRDVPSPIVSSAIRDVVVLPGDSGASTVVIDRALTTATYGSGGPPLELRFYATDSFATASGITSADVGGSRLSIRRAYGDASTSIATVPAADCSGDRGKCETGRFPTSRFEVSVDGPDPYAVHVLDTDAASATIPPVTVESSGAVNVVELHRETRRFVVVTTSDGSATTAYVATAEPSTHVVLDPPSGDRILVSAVPVSGGCEVSLAASASGFSSRPLVFTVDANCTATEDTLEPPRVPPPPPTPPGSQTRSGCGCTTGGSSTAPGFACMIGLLFVGLLRRRQSAGASVRGTMRR